MSDITTGKFHIEKIITGTEECEITSKHQKYLEKSSNLRTLMKEASQVPIKTI